MTSSIARSFRRFRLTDQPLVNSHVIPGHPPDEKSRFELPPAPSAIEPLYTLNRLSRPVNRIASKARDSLVDHLWNRAASPRHDRSAAGHRLNHHKAKRFWPVDRKQ